jgi:hypothetical protein
MQTMCLISCGAVGTLMLLSLACFCNTCYNEARHLEHLQRQKTSRPDLLMKLALAWQRRHREDCPVCCDRYP